MHLYFKRFKRLQLNALSLSLLFILLSLSAFLTACGKRKPPLPPVERVIQKVELSGFQRGDQIRLGWTMPNRNAPNGNLLNINRADIYRLVEPLTSSQTLSEDEFASRSTLIAMVPITDADFGRKTLNYFDKLDFAGQSVRLRYSVRFVNSEGQKAAFSNFMLIEPTAKVANKPTQLKLSFSQDDIDLRWESPQSNIDESKPANIVGFNVYRASAKETTASLLNDLPIDGNQFSDKTFSFGESYKYFVRAVSLGANAQRIESGESEIVEVRPKDTFAPSAPTAITLAASPTSISIFFVSNPESDVSGYKIFRSLDNIKWTLITPKLLETTTYQDLNVESGKTYFYYLIAVDKFGNESEKSEIVNETVP